MIDEEKKNLNLTDDGNKVSNEIESIYINGIKFYREFKTDDEENTENLLKVNL